METLNSYLICPTCQNRHQFKLYATVEIQVLGADYLTPLSEGYTSYGSNSVCVCERCAHQDMLDAFIGGGGPMLPDFVKEPVVRATERRAKATVHPIRPDA